MQLPSRPRADRAAAAVALHEGDFARATERALASADAAEEAGAPIEAALSRARSPSRAAGQSDRVAELQRAAALFDACGARRFREGAERELSSVAAPTGGHGRDGPTDLSQR